MYLLLSQFILSHYRWYRFWWHSTRWVDVNKHERSIWCRHLTHSWQLHSCDKTLLDYRSCTISCQMQTFLLLPTLLLLSIPLPLPNHNLPLLVYQRIWLEHRLMFTITMVKSHFHTCVYFFCSFLLLARWTNSLWMTITVIISTSDGRAGLWEEMLLGAIWPPKWLIHEAHQLVGSCKTPCHTTWKSLQTFPVLLLVTLHQTVAELFALLAGPVVQTIM